jgi:hypothetical protein
VTHGELLVEMTDCVDNFLSSDQLYKQCVLMLWRQCEHDPVSEEVDLCRSSWCEDADAIAADLECTEDTQDDVDKNSGDGGLEVIRME